MTKATRKTDLGQLWVTLCMADGQINCLTRQSDVSVADRKRLLMVHFKLRLKGYSASAIAKLCPAALLSHSAREVQSGLEGLPQVDAAITHEDVHDLDNLTDDQRTALNKSLAEQERQSLREQLAL